MGMYYTKSPLLRIATRDQLCKGAGFIEPMLHAPDYLLTAYIMGMEDAINNTDSFSEGFDNSSEKNNYYYGFRCEAADHYEVVGALKGERK